MAGARPAPLSAIENIRGREGVAPVRIVLELLDAPGHGRFPSLPEGNCAEALKSRGHLPKDRRSLFWRDVGWNLKVSHSIG